MLERLEDLLLSFLAEACLTFLLGFFDLGQAFAFCFGGCGFGPCFRFTAFHRRSCLSGLGFFLLRKFALTLFFSCLGRLLLLGNTFRFGTRFLCGQALLLGQTFLFLLDFLAGESFLLLALLFSLFRSCLCLGFPALGCVFGFADFVCLFLGQLAPAPLLCFLRCLLLGSQTFGFVCLFLGHLAPALFCCVLRSLLLGSQALGFVCLFLGHLAPALFCCVLRCLLLGGQAFGFVTSLFLGQLLLFRLPGLLLVGLLPGLCLLALPLILGPLADGPSVSLGLCFRLLGGSECRFEPRDTRACDSRLGAEHVGAIVGALQVSLHCTALKGLPLKPQRDFLQLFPEGDFVFGLFRARKICLHILKLRLRLRNSLVCPGKSLACLLQLLLGPPQTVRQFVGSLFRLGKRRFCPCDRHSISRERA